MQTAKAGPQSKTSANAPAPRPQRSVLVRWSGVGVTLVILALIEGLNRAGVRIPNPPAFYIMAVVFAAYTGGIAPGLVSAVITVGYAAYFFDSKAGAGFEYSDDNARRVVIWAVVTPLIALFVGGLKGRERRAARRELEAEVSRSLLAAQLESSKATEEALREAEARYRALFEQCPDGVMVVDPDEGRIVEANAALARLTGYYGGELATLRVSDIEALETPAQTREHMRRVLEKGFDEFETVLRCRDGSRREVVIVVKAVSIAGRPLFHTIVRDISERKRAEEELRESAERRLAILESALDCVITMDEAGRIIEFNPAAERTFGYERQEVMGRLVEETIIPSKARGAHSAGLTRYLTSGHGKVVGRRVEMTAQRASGEEFPVELAITPTRLKDGRLLFTAYLRDITVAKRAERALVDAELRYRSLVENSPMGIMVHQEGRFVYANESAVKLLHASSAGDLLGRDVLSVVHPDYIETVRERIARASSTGGPVPLIEEKLLRLDGSVVEVEVVGASTVFAGRPAVQVIVSDISERKRLLAELFQAQKMEAVGHLAAGITHDFNNLLTGIFAYIGLARQSLNADDPAAVALESVASAATQAAGVTRSLLTFSRRVSPEMTTVDLRGVVQEAIGLIRPSMPASINVVGPSGASGDRPVWVRADSVQLKQAIVNLALNSRDAMARGGVLTMGITVASEGGQARLAISDTGTGIAPDIRARIFDPFFTTKEDSQHTGLGLAIVDAIVKSHGGRIELDSKPGRGSVFTITLPINAPAPADAAVVSAVPVHIGRSVIVLVAENRQVRAVIATALRRAGHVVLEADDPVLMSDTADRYLPDLRLCVVDSTGIGSAAMAALSILRTRKPGIAVVVLSDSAEMPASLAGSEVHVVVKPFQVAQLVDLAERLLNPPIEFPMAAQTESPT